MIERGLRKKLVGTVVSNSMDKTALIMVERLTKHLKYGKYVRRRKKYMAHDPKSVSNIGDKVKIVESRPISKRKRWQVLNVIGKSKIENVIELK